MDGFDKRENIVGLVHTQLASKHQAQLQDIISISLDISSEAIAETISLSLFLSLLSFYVPYNIDVPIGIGNSGIRRYCTAR